MLCWLFWQVGASLGELDAEIQGFADGNEDNLDEVDHRHGAGKVLQYYTDMGQEK